MLFTEEYIIFNKSKIHYYKFGKGKKALLAFHGFGQSGRDFSVFEESLGNNFTIYSFDLFHHGKSKYQGRPVSPDDLKFLIHQFLDKEKIRQFSLIGFSLGGKVALKTMELFPKIVDAVFLLAPDGMKINPFYQFVSHTKLGSWVYSLVINHPNLFLNFLNFLRKTNIIGQRLYRFVFEQMNTRHKRELVLKTWITFRELNPNLNKIQHLVNESSINFYLFIGKKDRVIPLRFSKKLMSEIKDKNTLHLIDTGHTMLTDKVGKLILAQIST